MPAHVSQSLPWQVPDPTGKPVSSCLPAQRGTDVVDVSYTDAPGTGGWAGLLAFNDFTPDATGAVIAAATLTLEGAHGNCHGQATQQQGAFVVTFPAGSGLPADGSIDLIVRIAIPAPAADSTCRSTVTVAAGRIPEDDHGEPHEHERSTERSWTETPEPGPNRLTEPNATIRCREKPV